MRKYALPLLIGILLATNVMTFKYFNDLTSDLRSQSSFKVFGDKDNLPNGTGPLSACLSKAGIENKIENDSVLIREVDSNAAVSHCS